jgi:hypothetical protein
VYLHGVVTAFFLEEERRCQDTDAKQPPRRTARPTMEHQLGVREEERRIQEDRAGLPNLNRRQGSESQREEEQKLMRTAAIYVRVSTPRQGREQTIESQLAALKNWAGGNGYELSPENVYADEGYSGSRLDRPGLDALRDGAEDGLSRWSGS